MKTTVSEKGQVTIPRAIHDTLGLRPGTVLAFNVTKGKPFGVKKEQDDRLGRRRGKGALPGGLAGDRGSLRDYFTELTVWDPSRQQRRGRTLFMPASPGGGERHGGPRARSCARAPR